jgi:ParB/RepB/Spo0J family partition protein
MPDKERNEGELRIVQLDQIETRDGFNPRTAIDQERLDELTASIKQRGILQPLLLTQTEKGTLRLVAGHRRLAAARAAGLRQAPALIRAGDEQLEDALSENLVREDLNPIETARALARAVKQGRLGQKALAERLGKYPAYVRERLRLLRLPDQAQQALAAGELPLSAAAALERIAKVSAQVAEACVALVQAGHADAHQLEHAPARVVSMIERVEWKEGAPVAVATHARKQPDELPLGGRGEEIKRRYHALPDDRYGYKPGFALHAEEDAARAYGCLLEFKQDGHYGGQAFICDPEFIADRCLAQPERMEQAASERTEREAKRRGEALAAAG